ncbi:MAG: 50S ribosomal protein L17 [Candidatus Yanofskybacteria bacterium]|nr:50S ribosomal protein L17 [Candidatus Yanofskybacteria bacterium]
MRHGSKYRKFGRETKQRKALLSDLALALIEKDKIITTLAKAKSLRTSVEKLITKGKTKNLATTRLLASQLGIKYTKKLTTELAERFANRHGGYTRIINLPSRLSDGARMAIIEFVD